LSDFKNDSPDRLSFGHLIREYRTKQGLTQEQLGELVHVKKNAVGAWEAGRSRPDLASVPVLCEKLGIPLDVFFGVPISSDQNRLLIRFNRLDFQNQQIILHEMDMLYHVQSDKASIRPPKKIGLYLNDLSAAAGSVSYLGDQGGHIVYVYADDLTKRADEIIRISGDSMEPSFFDGDHVLVQHDYHLREGEVGIFVNDDAGYIKEYHKDGLYSHNPKYPPIRFNENDTVRCVGRVLGKIKPDQFSIE